MLPNVLRPNATDHVPVLAEEVREALAVRPGETVVRSVAAKQPPQLGEHGPLLLLVEPLEGGNAHGFHHLYKRRRSAVCEIGLKVLRSGELWFTVGRSGRCC